MANNTHTEPNALAIDVTGLRKEFGNVVAVKGVDLQVKSGEIFGFLGPNGAGKSTAIRILCGILLPTSGQGTVAGYDIINESEKIKKVIGYMSQHFGLYQDLTVEENLEFYSSIYLGRRAKEVKERLIKEMGLERYRKYLAGNLSGGWKQRLALACAVSHQPKILFLDEPVSALDPEGRLEMLELVDKLKKEEITILLSTHILTDAERVCDTICVIDEGKIILTESLSALYKKHMHPVLDIEFEYEPLQAQMTLNKIDWVRRMEISGKSLSLEVDDLAKAKKEIFQVLADLKDVAVSYRLRKRTLEDIFISIINKDD